MDTIPVIIESKSEKPEGTLSGGLSPIDKIKDISVEKMRESITKLSNGLSTILENVNTTGGFDIKEVQVQLEITSEGGVALVGTAKADIKGGITLTFARSTGT